MAMVILQSDKRAREKPCLRCGYSCRRWMIALVWVILRQLARRLPSRRLRFAWTFGKAASSAERD